MSVTENLNGLQEELGAYPLKNVVVVTKYATPTQIEEAFQYGIRDFGENRIQDLEQKWTCLPQEIVKASRWHFLGHLQRNKVNKALALGFHLVHSFDSLSLAEKMSQSALSHGSCQAVLLQVNLTRDPQKTGYLKEDLLRDFANIMVLKGVRVLGLMTIGPYPAPSQESLMIFQSLRELRDTIEFTFQNPLPELSMGMTKDFHHAIKCGATIIRVGTRIFRI